jgi:hypothetical protein
MRVGTLGRPGVFKLRSRTGRRKLSDRAPEAPDRRVVFNRVCLGCSDGAGSRQALLNFAAISAWRPNR